MPKKSEKTPKKPQKTKISGVAEAKKRVRPVTKHRNFKLTKKQHISRNPLPGVRKLFGGSISLVFGNKKLFLGLTIIYSLLLFVLTKGLGSAFNIVSVKHQVIDAIGNEGRSVSTSYELFNYLLGSFSSQAGDAAGTYQIVVSLIIILATVWITRQLYTGNKPLLRDGFYKGMYPLIPFLLVLAVISLQLLPLVIGNFIFSTVLANALAVTFVEKFIWFLLFLAFAMLSFYMLLSSIFALSIVTLPDMRPIAALRSARNLVLHRRIGIFARIAVLPIAAFLILAILFVPLIMYATVLVEPLFLLASSFVVIFSVVYLYNFYRQLL